MFPSVFVLLRSPPNCSYVVHLFEMDEVFPRLLASSGGWKQLAERMNRRKRKREDLADRRKEEAKRRRTKLEKWISGPKFPQDVESLEDFHKLTRGLTDESVTDFLECTRLSGPSFKEAKQGALRLLAKLQLKQRREALNHWIASSSNWPIGTLVEFEKYVGKAAVDTDAVLSLFLSENLDVDVPPTDSSIYAAIQLYDSTVKEKEKTEREWKKRKGPLERWIKGEFKGIKSLAAFSKFAGPHLSRTRGLGRFLKDHALHPLDELKKEARSVYAIAMEMKAPKKERRKKLLEALSALGLQRRGDSKLCDAYEDGRSEKTAEDVAHIMAQMRYIYTAFGALGTYNEMREELVEEYGYSWTEASNEARQIMNFPSKWPWMP